MTEKAPEPSYPFRLPVLRWAYSALEPHFDEQTLRLHHQEHHQSYVARLNAAIATLPQLHGLSIEAILRDLSLIPSNVRSKVRDLAGGHANHQFLWKVIGPPGTWPGERLVASLQQDFGSLEQFRARFEEAAMKQSVAGWAFLVIDPRSERLEVLALAGNESVLSVGKSGLLICDLFEHAYGRQYPARREDYLHAFWNVVDWGVVGARLEAFRANAAKL